MKKILVLSLLLASCMTRGSNDIEKLSNDCLKAKRGVYIEIRPIDFCKPPENR